MRRKATRMKVIMKGNKAQTHSSPAIERDHWERANRNIQNANTSRLMPKDLFSKSSDP
jgi:hypothetical protein